MSDTQARDFALGITPLLPLPGKRHQQEVAGCHIVITMKRPTSRKRRQIKKEVLPRVSTLPNIPDQDCRSRIPGVYFHAGKKEWRAICKHPFQNSLRSQRTFSVRKYGFYEAKQQAEVVAIEWEEHRRLVCSIATAYPSRPWIQEYNTPASVQTQPIYRTPYVQHVPCMPCMYGQVCPWAWGSHHPNETATMQ